MESDTEDNSVCVIRSAPLVEMRDGVPFWLVPGSLERGTPVYARDERLERLWRGEPEQLELWAA